MSSFALNEPRWRAFQGRRLPLVPRRYYRWLRDTDSLTQRVIDACPVEFRVQVRDQRYGVPLLSERQVLAMGRTRLALIREVELRCGEDAWVFARTVIPTRSLSGRAGHLARLGERPLGAVLFADPTTRRGNLEFARFVAGQVVYEAAVVHLTARPAALWGRRAVFYYAGKPLLVNEIFLPTIPSV